MLDARTLGISVGHPWRDLYEAIWRPAFFPRWASGLSTASLRQDGDAWIAAGPEGMVTIRFTGHNDFGVMDHTVELADGHIVTIPMRVIANGDGAEVLVTLFRQPGMTDAKVEADAAWIARDLATLKSLFHGRPAGVGDDARPFGFDSE